MQGARISPKPSPTERGAAVGAQVATGCTAKAALLISSEAPQHAFPMVRDYGGSHRPWCHPPGLTSVASQKDSRLPIRVRKAQRHQPLLRRTSSKPFREHASLCTFAKEILQRQILSKKCFTHKVIEFACYLIDPGRFKAAMCSCSPPHRESQCPGPAAPSFLQHMLPETRKEQLGAKLPPSSGASVQLFPGEK